MVVILSSAALSRRYPRSSSFCRCCPWPRDGAASEARELAPNGGSRVEYIHEPAAGGILDMLVPQSVEVAVLGCLLEAAASETGAWWP